MRLSKQAKLYRAKWTNKINDEWATKLSKNRPGLAKRDIEATVSWMNRTISDALVDPEPFMPSAKKLAIPDKKDIHVVAAAMASQANFIVTKNLKDFPSPLLSPIGIESIHPDDFVLGYIEDYPEEVFGTIVKMSTDYASPPMIPQEIIEAVVTAELPRSANKLYGLISV